MLSNCYTDLTKNVQRYNMVKYEIRSKRECK